MQLKVLLPIEIRTGANRFDILNLLREALADLTPEDLAEVGIIGFKDLFIVQPTPLQKSSGLKTYSSG